MLPRRHVEKLTTREWRTKRQTRMSARRRAPTSPRSRPWTTTSRQHRQPKPSLPWRIWRTALVTNSRNLLLSSRSACRAWKHLKRQPRVSMTRTRFPTFSSRLSSSSKASQVPKALCAKACLSVTRMCVMSARTRFRSLLKEIHVVNALETQANRSRLPNLSRMIPQRRSSRQVNSAAATLPSINL